MAKRGQVWRKYTVYLDGRPIGDIWARGQQDAKRRMDNRITGGLMTMIFNMKAVAIKGAVFRKGVEPKKKAKEPLFKICCPSCGARDHTPGVLCPSCEEALTQVC